MTGCLDILSARFDRLRWFDGNPLIAEKLTAYDRGLGDFDDEEVVMAERTKNGRSYS